MAFRLLVNCGDTYFGRVLLEELKKRDIASSYEVRVIYDNSNNNNNNNNDNNNNNTPSDGFIRISRVRDHDIK